MKEKLLKYIWRVLPFAAIIAVLAGFAVWLNRPVDGEVDSAASRLVYEPARVTAVLEDNAEPDYENAEGRRVGDQELEIEILSGTHRGEIMTVTNYMSALFNVDVQEGAQISAVGFVSHDAEGNRLRVRDRSEILAVSDAEEPVPENYKVTVSVENGSFEGPETAADGSDYTGTVRAADGYRLPDSIAVKVDGQELARDVYAWDASSGTLTIPGNLVTGDLEIMAVCAAESGDDSQGGQQTPDDDAQGDQNNQQKPGGGQNNQNQNGQQSQGGGSSVQTGDPVAAGAWAAVLILAAAGVTVLLTGRKRIRK